MRQPVCVTALIPRTPSHLISKTHPASSKGCAEVSSIGGTTAGITATAEDLRDTISAPRLCSHYSRGSRTTAGRSEQSLDDVALYFGEPQSEVLRHAQELLKPRKPV